MDINWRGNMEMAVPFTIGLLCMILGLRARKYQKLGTRDPYSMYLIYPIVALALVSLFLFIRQLHNL
jgi:hypothetical protein